MPISRRFACLAALGAALLCAMTAPRADAAGGWMVRGAGNGHGVGMSQYGALGFARHGFNYQAILAHYYTGTTLGTTTTSTVRVLVAADRPTVSFSGADSACGQSLDEGTTYSAKVKGGKVLLLNANGGRLGACGGLLSATGGDTISVAGAGLYHGSLEVRASKTRGKLNAINAVDIESYVRGVIPKESPPSWPLEALKAQAVAARSYALSSRVKGAGFDQYADTRSQVYGGASAENANSNLAVAQTALQVVTFQGQIAETFFFSTSGGQTEDNENSFIGGTPLPYLRGVPDPYEGETNSPYLAWTRNFSAATLKAKLGRRVKGRLRNIVVIKRGSSPRIVKARIVGSGGSSMISGPDLKAALGLPATWAYFAKSRVYRRTIAATLRTIVLP